MRERLYNIAAVLFASWAIGFFELKFGILIHALFIAATLLALYQHLVDRQLTMYSRV